MTPKFLSSSSPAENSIQAVCTPLTTPVYRVGDPSTVRSSAEASTVLFVRG